MTAHDAPPRIPRLRPDQLTDQTREIFALFSGPGRINVDTNHVLNTLAWHPELATLFLRFNSFLLLSSTLPVRLRQLAIMRVAWLRGGRYVWSSHLRTSLRNGFSGDEFEPLKAGSQAPVWDDRERVVLRATEQLLAQNNLDDGHWETLAGFLDRSQVLELLFTVGCYETLSMVCNALRIDREPELVALAEQYGAPSAQG